MICLLGFGIWKGMRCHGWDEDDAFGGLGRGLFLSNCTLEGR